MEDDCISTLDESPVGRDGERRFRQLSLEAGLPTGGPQVSAEDDAILGVKSWE